ncbi:unnamed protein product [Bursaphelenchus okinawaensis]|uniref:Uncharacterized protein n=1 Tax=Bursaphelenchus okinawaensis TaxID=465554 RepID=A0A811LAS1_9BILA|nr:unnamed protein product [Bursaphelenchus okinawaensis]CAG9120682.1 unnamed protein product [Bursaphelenchus okinawaensis]
MTKLQLDNVQTAKPHWERTLQFFVVTKPTPSDAQPVTTAVKDLQMSVVQLKSMKLSRQRSRVATKTQDKNFDSRIPLDEVKSINRDFKPVLFPQRQWGDVRIKQRVQFKVENRFVLPVNLAGVSPILG